MKEKLMKMFNINRDKEIILLINFKYLDECLGLIKDLFIKDELLILISNEMPEDIKISIMDQKNYFNSKYYLKELNKLYE